MTVTSGYAMQSYNGDGSTTQFNFGMPFYAPSDLVVVLLNAGAAVVPAPLLNGVGSYDYTVTGAADANTGEYPGATVTFNTAPPAGYTVRLARATPATQPNSFQTAGPFPAKTVESTADRVTLVVQQLIEALGRAILAPIGDTPMGPLPLAAARASQLLGFDASGNPIASQPGSALVSTVMQPVVAAATLAAALAAMGAQPAGAYQPANTPLFGFGRNSVASQAATITLTAAAIGTFLYLSGSNQTVNLPPAATLAVGDSVLISNGTSGDSLVQTQDGTRITSWPNTNAAIALAQAEGEFNAYTWDGAEWLATGSSNARLALFQTVHAGATGWRALADFSYEQWGTGTLSGGVATITFPLAFPTACLVQMAIPNGVNAAGTFPALAIGAVTDTGMTVYGPSGSAQTFNWRVLGY